MTQEQKAQAYDEALGWMREMYPCLTDSLREDAEHYFPELAESEDERIRKFLIQHISEWIGCIEHDLKNSSKDIESEKELAMFKAGLAYLEKQKDSKWSPSESEMGVLYKLCYISNQVTDEDDTNLTRLYQDLKREYFNGHSFENMFPSEKQKESLPISEICKENANSFIDGIIEVRSFQRGMEEGRKLEKQEEQKPVECIEFDNEFEKQVSHLLASVLNGEWEYNEDFVKYAAQSLLGYAKNEMKPDEWDKREKLFRKALQAANARIGQLFEENQKLKEQKLEKYAQRLQKEQKQAQTSEEKEYIRTIKSIISDFIRDKKPENLAYYQRIYDWLDGRHVPFSCGHENGQPAEWSEEDENALKYIHELLVFGYTEKFMDAQTAHDMRKWVNEHLRTDTFQNGNSHWKPSEQEKGALRTAIHVLTEERNFPKAAAQLQNILDAFEGKESRKDWKPSEEQKEALEYVIRDYREDSCNATANYLQEILDHLKNM